jgi:hypothetical protein
MKPLAEPLTHSRKLTVPMALRNRRSTEKPSNFTSHGKTLSSYRNVWCPRTRATGRLHPHVFQYALELCTGRVTSSLTARCSWQMQPPDPSPLPKSRCRIQLGARLTLSTCSHIILLKSILISSMQTWVSKLEIFLWSFLTKTFMNFSSSHACYTLHPSHQPCCCSYEVPRHKISPAARYLFLRSKYLDLRGRKWREVDASTNAIRVIKSRRMRWAGNVASMGEMRNE